jgi:hypothetical protein
MRNRSRIIAAAVAVTAVLAVGSAAAVASATGGKPGAPARTVSASEKPRTSEKAGHDAMVAAVARQLHVSTARVGVALQPLFAAGHADASSPAFAAAARSLGVSTQQLADALLHAKQSLAAGMPAGQNPGGAKATSSPPAEDQQGHDAMVAAVARQLHVSTARVSAALQPLFTAGHADVPSPAFTAAARSLGVSTEQLSAALGHAKQSLAGGK